MRNGVWPVFFWVVLGAVAAAQNCSQTSVGFTPLNDLGTLTYMGFEGGLYPQGSNVRPAAHEANALAQAARVEPLDASGQPDPQGRIVLLSVGMSNTSQEFTAWLPVSNADPERASSVTVVNGAQGGQHALAISTPSAPFWSVVETRLQQAGVTPAQVQAVWLKEALPGPTEGFPLHAQTLQGLLKTISQILVTKYPNIKLCYLSSRIYAGYAVSTLNPEPYAYESGFSVKWLIEDQIQGDPALNWDPTAGPVLAPLLAWGPYTWADGLVPRSDGLIWECADFSGDGTHPSPAGRDKVAAMLQAFFASDTSTVPWYVGTGGPKIPPAARSFYGVGCPGTNGIPGIVTNTLPILGTPNFRIGVQQARPDAQATLFASLAQAALPFGTCTVWIDPTQLLVPHPAFNTTITTNQQGSGILEIPIPQEPALGGVTLSAQWLVIDPQGAAFPELGGAALSRGLSLTFGS